MKAAKKKKQESEHLERAEGHPYRVRLPGFITDRDVGLGEVIKRATSSFGIKPCGGCQRRAERLNRLLVFSRRRER